MRGWIFCSFTKVALPVVSVAVVVAAVAVATAVNMNWWYCAGDLLNH